MGAGSLTRYRAMLAIESSEPAGRIVEYHHTSSLNDLCKRGLVSIWLILNWFISRMLVVFGTVRVRQLDHNLRGPGGKRP